MTTKKTTAKYTVGQTLVSKTTAGPVKRGDAVIVLSVGQGSFNLPFYKVRLVTDAGATAFISEQNLATQMELL